MKIPLADITRIAVFVHPGQLKEGCLHIVTLHDGYRDDEPFEEKLSYWRDAICLYDGPPMELPLGGKK